MLHRRFTMRCLFASLLVGASSVMTFAAPNPADILKFQPRQEGINITIPTEAQLESCKVELIKGTMVANGKASSGWLLRDGQGKPVRRFFDSDGDQQIDVYSYYLDGKEAYREVDSNFNGKIDQFRWLGANGSKWGADLNEDGKIDSWKMISPEEVSQELLLALTANDAARFQALLINKAELDAMEMPEAEQARIRAGVTRATEKFEKTSAALTAQGKATWVHLQTTAPSCVPADSLGGRYDLVSYKSGTILYQSGEKHDFIQTGEIVQVGRAYRLIDGPAMGSRGAEMVANNPGVGISDLPEAIKKLIEVDLKKIDENAPKTGSTPTEIVKYNLARAEVLEKVTSGVKGEPRDIWLRQLVDCLSTAAQNSDKDDAAYTRLVEIRKTVSKDQPNSNLAAFITYREMAAEYAIKLPRAKQDEMAKLQEGWRDRLGKFVQEFPTAEDTPEALMQLGMVNEFLGKETEAKNWYKNLADNFKQHPYAPKAFGALKRLNLDGQELELTGTLLGSSTPFDVKSLKGKTVVVYYWASWNGQCAEDFKKLKTIQSTYAAKGVEVVSINLDNTVEEANAFLKDRNFPASHLFQPGGLESPFAISYGVMVLPNAYLINPEGKVLNRNLQIATLEDDLKKLLK
jgi:thiol-disulfide isomerase/thioredoxin